MKGVCIDNSGDDRGSRKTGKFHRNESAAAAAATAAPPALPAHTPGFWIFPPMEKTTNSKVTATVFLCDNLFVCFFFNIYDRAVLTAQCRSRLRLEVRLWRSQVIYNKENKNNK